ncbi:MAG: sigma-70 family RNA polymerase sigma factor, partial [Gammaproteobacteria bacterium]|nr:sigma-70 family RNA polymerase sigma factor [Gammaproteobacteria bacterium]
PALTEEIIEQRQTSNALVKAIGQLTEEEQQVIILRFVEGISHGEVSEIIGKSNEASRVIQHRALIKLNKLLKS